MNDRPIYLDNAATSYPKPCHVLDEMLRGYRELGVSPGRGSYDLAVQAGDVVEQTRKKLARFFGAPDANRVVFAANATDALNMVFNDLTLVGTLGGVEMGLACAGVQFQRGGVMAALDYLTAK